MTQNETLEKIWGATPEWLPRKVLVYIAHINWGLSMREIARELGIEPSTVSRNVKSVSKSLSDPLYRTGLARILSSIEKTSQLASQCPDTLYTKNHEALKTFKSQHAEYHNRRDQKKLFLELSQLNDELKVSSDFEQSSLKKNQSKHIGVGERLCDKEAFERFSFSEDLQIDFKVKVLSNHAPSNVGWDSRIGVSTSVKNKFTGYLRSNNSSATAKPLKLNFFPNMKPKSRRSANLEAKAELPLVSLSRKRDKNGNAFLSSELVKVGQMFREDFELAKLNASIIESDGKVAALLGDKIWTTQLQPFLSVDPARRLTDALNILGPALFDVAVRCCCRFQGIQKIEKDLGWPARSGKIVFRIALMQLSELYGVIERHRST